MIDRGNPGGRGPAAREHTPRLLAAVALSWFGAFGCLGREADIWSGAGDVRVPANRTEVVEKLRSWQEALKGEALERAALAGLPARQARPDGGLRELMAWEGGRPLYYGTCNANAGISSGSCALRQPPYAADGAGWTVGVWDGGAVRATHQEFGGRVTVMDGAAAVNHSTHVGGTIGAAGVLAAAVGMARSARIDSYDWNSDTSEMVARGAAYGGEPGKIYISNHSYGVLSGWYPTGLASPAWEWYGSGATPAAVEDDFGKYGSYTRDLDARAYNLPYYTIFWAAGNERADAPATGAPVALSPGGGTAAYDPGLHPPADSAYRGGFDTISYHALAKNVVTVGAVGDAVSGGVRDPAQAVMVSFSSWGPADDGRIKPDVVANGASLLSAGSAGDAAYTFMSGTSMAAPSAAGTAQQLLELYAARFPGQYLRASTLKGLLIHTADDLGAAGPDYAFGWGLVNAQAAADLIVAAATNPLAPRLVEQQLTAGVTARAHRFAWDGVSPVRVTLCWTDPAGAYTTAHDSRTARLVNNLDLRVTGPGGTLHLPFVMPFVGSWTPESMAAPATRGTNRTDNVEQVVIAGPPGEGDYLAVVSCEGALANGVQAYSLLISGGAAPAPKPLALAPRVASSGPTALVLSGEGFSPGAAVAWVREGFGDVAVPVSGLTATSIWFTADVTPLAAGAWGVRVTNPDGKAGSLAEALSVHLPAVASVSPDWGERERVAVTVAGSHFAEGAAVDFLRDGEPVVSASVASVASNEIQCTVAVDAMAQGPWAVRVTNRGGKAGQLAGAFAVVGSLAEQSFDAGAQAWTAGGGWMLTTAVWQTPTSAFSVAGTAVRRTDTLLSEAFGISATAQRLRLHFWHLFSSECYDGGLLELSPDDGTRWCEVGADGSGAAFVKGGYAGGVILGRKGKPGDQAELVGRGAWTGVVARVFSEVVVALDPAVYGGGSLRARWRFSSDAAAASGGWSVDSVRLSGFDTSNGRPVIAEAAADPPVVAGTSTVLRVTAEDDGGSEELVFSWACSGPAPVRFSENGTRTAVQTVASFAAAGAYMFTVTARDAEGLSASETMAVEVAAVPAAVDVSPASAGVQAGGEQLFVAKARDQFGATLAKQPAFGWSVSGGGELGSSGLFRAGSVPGGPFAVRASAQGASGLAEVTVTARSGGTRVLVQ